MDYILGFLILAFALYGAVSLGLLIATRVIPARREQRRIARYHRQMIDKAPDVVITETTPPLSWASREVLREHEALPEESRTYGDIEDTLRALDTKHDRAKLNSHLCGWETADYGYDAAYSWTPSRWNPAEDGCKHSGCLASDHYALHRAIESIRLAIAEKEKRIALAGVEHELGQVPSLLESLKIEAEAHRP